MSKRQLNDNLITKGGIDFIRKPLMENGRRQTVDQVARLFDGIYVTSGRQTSRLVKLVKRDADDDEYKRFLKRRFGTNSEADSNHPIVRLYNNIDDYNQVFSITQKLELTLGMSNSDVKVFLAQRWTEEKLLELLLTIPQKDLAFRSILPLYSVGMIEEIVLGPSIMTSILNFIREEDVYHLFTSGSLMKCLNALRKSGKCVFLRENLPVPTSGSALNSKQPFDYYFLVNNHQNMDPELVFQSLALPSFDALLFIQASDSLNGLLSVPYDGAKKYSQTHANHVELSELIEKKSVLFVVNDESVKKRLVNINLSSGKILTPLELLQFSGSIRQNFQEAVIVFSSKRNELIWSTASHSLWPSQSRSEMLRDLIHRVYGIKMSSISTSVVPYDFDKKP